MAFGVHRHVGWLVASYLSIAPCEQPFPIATLAGSVYKIECTHGLCARHSLLLGLSVLFETAAKLPFAIMNMKM